jgi:signal transduction histidine kinase
VQSFHLALLGNLIDIFVVISLRAIHHYMNRDMINTAFQMYSIRSIAVLLCLWCAVIPHVLLAQIKTSSQINITKTPALPRHILRAQDFPVERVSEKLGVQLANILSMIQDRQGFLWIATADGFYRFDGYEFRTFRHDPSNPHSLSENGVNTLYEDPVTGNIWLPTLHGLCELDPRTERFTTYPIQGAHTSLLPQRTFCVNHLVRDRFNTYWIATDQGLLRYHPTKKQFLSFRAGKTGEGVHNDNGRQISNDVALYVYTDAFGRVWFNTDGGGVNAFAPLSWEESERLGMPGYITVFKRQPSFQHPASLSSDYVNRMTIDDEGNFWCGTWGEGITRISPSHVSSTHVSSHVPSSHNAAAAPPFSTYRTDVLLADKTPKLAEMLTVLGKGRVNAFPSDIRLRNGCINGIAHEANGVTWIATWGGGLSRFDPATGEVTTLMHDITDPQSLPGNLVTSVFADRFGTIWVGVLGKGLCRLQSRPSLFRAYRHNPEKPTQALSNNIVLSVLEENPTTVWLGTGGGGLNRFDRVTERFTAFFNYGSAMTDNRRTSSVIAGLAWDYTPQLMPLPAHRRLWLATRGSGMRLFDPVTRRARNFPPAAPANLLDSTSLTSGFLNDIVSHPSGRTLVVGGEPAPYYLQEIRGVSRNEIAQKIYAQFEANVQGSKGDIRDGYVRFETLDAQVRDAQVRDAQAQTAPSVVSSLTKSSSATVVRHISAMAFEPNSNGDVVWLGGAEGLARLNLRTRIFEHLSAEAHSPRTIKGNRVQMLHFDHKGALWVGTTHGIAKRFPSGKWLEIGEQNGLPSSFIAGIVEDTHGNIWVSTNQGLARLTPQENTNGNEHKNDTAYAIRTYSRHDGLPIMDFVAGAVARLSDGTLCFGSNEGLLLVRAAIQETGKENTPTVMLTRIDVFNKPYPLDSVLSHKRSLHLDYRQNVITLHFAAPTVVAPERIRYRYRLQGFDADWTEAGTRREATYTNLDGGTYRFDVQACTPEGVWGSINAELTLTIEPPFWKTRWFLGGVLLSILAATAVGIRIAYKRQLRKQYAAYEQAAAQAHAEHLRQMEITRIQAATQANERERIFRDIHDGLGAQIVEIAALSEQIKYDITTMIEERSSEGLTLTTQSQWAEAITTSAQDLRTSLREIVWLLNMENDNLQALLAYIRQEIGRMAQNAGLNFEFVANDDEYLDIPVTPEIRRNLVMAIREACANVLKHAGADRITITATNTPRTLTMRVHDNGRGFLQSDIRQFSNGLKTMQKRMRECGGSFTLESSPGNGTTVVFSVALSP